MKKMAYVFYVLSVADDSVLASGGFSAGADGVGNAPSNAPAKGGIEGGFTKHFSSQDEASAQGKSWNRQLQAAGLDTRMEVWGGPVGTDVANSVYTLSADEKKFYKYEGVDTIGLGLRQRIADANRVAGAGGGGYSDDKVPEIVAA